MAIVKGKGRGKQGPGGRPNPFNAHGWDTKGKSTGKGTTGKGKGNEMKKQLVCNGSGGVGHPRRLCPTYTNSMEEDSIAEDESETHENDDEEPELCVQDDRRRKIRQDEQGRSARQKRTHGRKDSAAKRGKCVLAWMRTSRPRKKLVRETRKVLQNEGRLKLTPMR